jgi:predicted DNA-binding protein YlxM (UPF0122 family)
MAVFKQRNLMQYFAVIFAGVVFIAKVFELSNASIAEKISKQRKQMLSFAKYDAKLQIIVNEN